MTKQRGVIICLGKALREKGRPEPMLLNRCDQAIQVHRETGFPIIASGADTMKVGISEAQVMSRYMRSQDPLLPIILEEEANNTVENFQYCFRIAAELQATHVVLVTCEHHMPRATYVCRAVMNHLSLFYNLSNSATPDDAELSLKLRREEYKKIFTTPSYLTRCFAIQPPEDMFFSDARKTLENLIKIKTMRRKSFVETHLDHMMDENDHERLM